MGRDGPWLRELICKVQYRRDGLSIESSVAPPQTSRSNPVHSPAHPSFPIPVRVPRERLPTHHLLGLFLLLPFLLLCYYYYLICQPMFPTNRQYCDGERAETRQAFVRTPFGAISHAVPS